MNLALAGTNGGVPVSDAPRPTQNLPELFHYPALVRPPPIQLVPADKGRSVERTALVCLLVALAFAAGYAASEYGHFRAWLERHTSVPQGDAVISVPPEVRISLGEPTEVTANTRGERVVWQSLDRTGGLSLKVSGQPKTALVTGKKPGIYVVQAYTAIDNVPSTPALVSVVVEAEKVEGKK